MTIEAVTAEREKPLKILCLSEHFSPLIGGTVTYVENICENMVGLGHAVFLITYSTDYTSFPPGKWVPHRGYQVYNTGLSAGAKYNSRHSRKNFCAQVKKLITKKIQETNADVVHVLYGHFLAELFNKQNAPVPAIWTVNNVPPHEYAPLYPTRSPKINSIATALYFKIVEKIDNRRFKKYHFNKIISASKYTQKLLVSKHIPADKITIIPHGIDETKIKPRELKKTTKNFPIILCVAPIADHKGQAILLKALPKVLRFYPNAKIINIGRIAEQKYKQVLERDMAELSLAQNWEFVTNPLSREELNNHYANCDVYVQPSLEEGFCLSFLEACAFGKPTVGTATGAIPEIMACVDSKNICPINDSGCLADKLLLALKSAETKNFDGEKQFQKIANCYAWRLIAKKTLTCYRQVLFQ